MGPDASLTPELIQAQSFTTTFRGYDAAEVKAFLNRVATEMRAWKERAEGLESAWHSAEERAARPPVLDEDTLMAAVGEETAAILRTARAAAADMRAKAAEESERVLSEARTEADQALTEARAEAERTLTEARSEAELALAEARAEAERMGQEAEATLSAAVAAAEEQAASLLAVARQEAAEVLERTARDAEEIRGKAEKERQLTIEGANSTRDRILEDLSRRRRVATVQIEQLRAGRERLIESYAVVRRTLEEVQSELSRADAEARLAADDVGRRLKDQPDVELSESSRAMTDPVQPPATETTETPETAEATETTETRETAEATETTETPETAEATETTETAGTAESTQTVEPEAASGSTDVDEPDGGSAVDELFARIRGSRASGDPVVGDDAAPPVDPTAGAEAAAAAAAVAAAAVAPTAEAGVAPTAEAGVAPTAEAETERPADASSAPSAEAATPAARRGPKKRAAERAASNGRHPAHGEDAGAGIATAGTSLPRSAVRVIEPEAAPAASGDPDDDVRAEAPATGQEASDAEAGEAPVADGDESLMQAREFAVEDLEVNLTRRLKRALQDEQNDVLDRLRNLKESPTAARLLPEEKAQVARYAGAARPLLAEAATAGALFTDETLGLPGRDAPVDVDVADLAEECGTGIVSALRRRLEQAIETGDGEDQAVLVESLGAAYREWKTQRIERLAGDVLSAAFSRGTWQAAPGGAHFRWVVEDTEGPCPDCDDDSLAGDIPKGEAFPTGQHHPPAHSGCRCLLVPSLPTN